MAKVLVMDDSKIYRLRLRELLVTNGYEVCEAIDGQDAWEQLSSGVISPDFLLLDVNTPRLDGVQLCEKLFENKVCEGRPIILITTEATVELKVRAKKCGVRAWLLKPVQAEKLLKTMGHVANKPDDSGGDKSDSGVGCTRCWADFSFAMTSRSST